MSALHAHPRQPRVGMAPTYLRHDVPQDDEVEPRLADAPAGGHRRTAVVGQAVEELRCRGVGGHQTLILTTGVGGTSMRTSALYNTQLQTIYGTTTQSYVGGENQLAGPHFAVGVEYRL